MAEPVATDGVAAEGRHGVAEEHTSVEHGLQGEAFAEGERHAPVGSDVAQAGLAVELCEVVGHVGIFSLEAGTACGEDPVVLAVVACLSAIAEVVVVAEDHRIVHSVGHQLVLIAHVVPAQSHLQVEVAEVVVEGNEVHLMVMIEDAVVAVAIDIDVYVVAAEGIVHGRTAKAARMYGPGSVYHHAFAQSHRQVGVHGDGSLHGEFGTHL